MFGAHGDRERQRAPRNFVQSFGWEGYAMKGMDRLVVFIVATALRGCAGILGAEEDWTMRRRCGYHACLEDDDVKETSL